jgi:hypothetical protein
MRTFLRVYPAAAVLALAFVAGAAPAQAPPAAAAPANSADAPIVVTGARLSPREARLRAVAFVNGTGVASGERSVARWVDPVCMSVVGISDRHAGIVVERLRRIAVAAGVPVARGSCQTNMAVVFTQDAGETVREVERRAPRRLEEVTGPSRARLVDGDAPIRWWYTTQPRSRHGMRQATNAPGFAHTDGGGADGANTASGGGSALPDNVPNLYHYNSSIISTQSVRALVAASVIVDVNAMDRMPLESVAAYVAMVAFAEIRENDFSSPGSILGMFEAAPSAPRALTEWDMAFLRVLYRLPLDRDARRHRGILVRDLLEAVEAGG